MKRDGSQPGQGILLAELLRGIVDAPLGTAGAARVSSVCDDSRRAEPGSVFVAVRGSAADGLVFAADAAQRGAIAVISEAPTALPGACCLRVDDARRALALLAARWHGLDDPRRPLPALLGVTGTNGKSTTAFMTAAILRAGGDKCAMLGTVQYDLCRRTITAGMTTPGPLELSAYVREATDAGARAIVMEVSSHALDQHRTAGLRFRAAAFTNLTQDHLDYHSDMEAYAAAKARLFAGLTVDAVAVVNRDDPASARMLRDCRARVMEYGLRGAGPLSAEITRDSVLGTLYRMRLPDGELVLENALVGRHNVYNALAAAGLALAAGATAQQIATGLQSVRNVPGRLQRVPCVPGVDVFVDYAHTEDALRNVLSVLKPLTRRRLVVLFGCGGDRDRTKRPRMAAAVEEAADVVIVTSDNPRTEAPQSIIQDILAGFDAAARRRVAVEVDRRAAIRLALQQAGAGDVVLIAGKGHEDYQIVGREKLHFDDVAVAIEVGAALGHRLQESTP